MTPHDAASSGGQARRWLSSRRFVSGCSGARSAAESSNERRRNPDLERSETCADLVHLNPAMKGVCDIATKSLANFPK